MGRVNEFPYQIAVILSFSSIDTSHHDLQMQTNENDSAQDVYEDIRFPSIPGIFRSEELEELAKRRRSISFLLLFSVNKII